MLRPAVLVALLSLAASAAAQTSPFGTPLFDAGYYALHAAAGDLDGDDLVDLVVANQESVILVRQVAPGQFGPPVTLAEQDWIDRPMLADLDGDGDLDVAATVDFGHPDFQDFVAVLLGGGDGSLGEPDLLLASSGPTDLGVADLDADGAPDLLAPSAASTRLSLFFGNGDGSFQPKHDVGMGLQPYGLDVGLVDADDSLDVVVVSASGTCKTFAGDGAGGLGEAASLGVGEGTRDVSLGSVDADGDADALLVYGSALQYRVMLGLGDGSFVPKVPVFVSTFTVDGELADVDEDGDDDVVVLLGDAFFIPEVTGFMVQASLGDGTFAAPEGYGTDREPADLVVEDLNHDGDLDLFATTPQTIPQVTGVLLPGRGDGTFGPVQRTGDGPEEAALGDLDLDGVQDLVVACGSADAVAVHGGLGHGAFGPPTSTFFGDFPVGLAVADIFEDGVPDVVVANRTNPGRLTARSGDGALGFGITIVSAPGAVPFGMSSGDVNLDGHLDVVATCSNGTARLLLGDGAGAFAFADSVAGGSSTPDASAIGDLNADGWPDLVIAPTANAVVVRALGDGTGLLEPATMVPVPFHNQHDVALGDLDGDLDLDVVSSGGFLGGLNSLLNDGSGAFAAGPAFTHPATWGVAIAEVTGDGLPDVVAAAESQVGTSAFGAVVTWPSLGGGGFGPPATVTVAAHVQELLVDDLDGDGVGDALALALEDDDLWLLPSGLGPWDDRGHPLAGVQGLPRQRGFGTLQPGAPFEFLLTDARPGGATFHVAGLSALEAPFKGGVMVPMPVLVGGPYPIDAEGGNTLAGAWPGPAAPGLQLYFQYWQQDPAGPKGWSASNALRTTLP